VAVPVITAGSLTALTVRVNVSLTLSEPSLAVTFSSISPL